MLCAAAIAVSATGFAEAKTENPQPPSTQVFNLETGHAAFEVIYPAVGPRLRTWIGQVAMDGTLVLRVSANMEGAWYDATAPYHPTAVGIYSDLGRRPASEATTKNINIAMIYSSYRVMNSLIPAYEPLWRDMVKAGGLDPDDNSLDRTTAVGLGNLGGYAWVEARQYDGMNQLGNEGGQKYHKKPYADYTGYQPVNTAYQIRNPSRWQPALVSSGNGLFETQSFVTAQMAVTKPISFARAKEFTLPPPTKSNYYGDRRGYKQQADEVLAQSASLTDQKKLQAELFNDKLNFARSYPDLTRGRGMLEFVQQAAAVHVASFDALLVAWYNKKKYDAPRPFTAITFLYGDKKVSAWGGPGLGTVKDMPANQWRSYLQVGDHPDYPSGTTTFCGAQMQVGKRWLGTENITASYTWAKGASYIEPGVTPAQETTLTWNTWTDYLNACVDSRVIAGVHFRSAAENGAAIGKKVGDRAYEFVQAHIRGEHIRF